MYCVAVELWQKNAIKAHCVNGHDFGEENLYLGAVIAGAGLVTPPRKKEISRPQEPTVGDIAAGAQEIAGKAQGDI